MTDQTAGHPPDAPVLYRAYLLRLWRDGAGRPWRASLQPPGGGDVLRFGSAAALLAFLRDQVADASKGGEGMEPDGAGTPRSHRDDESAR